MNEETVTVLEEECGWFKVLMQGHCRDRRAL